MFRRKPLAALAPPLFALIVALPAYAEEGPVVVVTATRQAQPINELITDVTVIERESIEQAGSGTVIDLLSRQPGIQMMQMGGPGTTTELYLRGARADQTKIVVDGVPINSMDIKGSPLRFIPLDQVERIEIVRGPGSTLYGADAIGGVIQVITRRNREGVGGDTFVGLGTDHSHRVAGAVHMGNDRLRLGIAANDYRIRNFSSVRDATKADADVDLHKNNGFNAYADLDIAPGHEISASWMRNRGKTAADTGAGTGNWDNRIYFFNETWSVGTKSRINSRWTTRLRYGQNTDDQSSFSSSLTPSLLVTEGRQLAWQNDIALPLGTGLVLVERQEQKAAPASRFPRNTITAEDAVALGWTANWQKHRWQWSHRHTRNSSFGTNSTWAAGYGHQIDEYWRVGIAGGKSYKAPTLYQLYATLAGSLNPNPDLQPEQGHSREISLTWEKGGWNAGLVRYRNRLDNMIDYVSTSKRYENISQAMLQGWTLTLGGRLGDWNMNSSLDFLDAKNIATGKSLERRASQKLSLSVSRSWGAWHIGGETMYVGPRFNSTTDTQTMGGYTLVNLLARHALSRSLTLEMRGDNITNKHYATVLIANGSKEYATPGATLFVGLRYTTF